MCPINLMWSDVLRRIIKHMVLGILRLFSGSLPSVFPLKSVWERALWTAPGFVSDACATVHQCLPWRRPECASMAAALPHLSEAYMQSCSVTVSHLTL